jgi:hypothetical protein
MKRSSEDGIALIAVLWARIARNAADNASPRAAIRVERETDLVAVIARTCGNSGSETSAGAQWASRWLKF